MVAIMRYNKPFEMNTHFLGSYCIKICLNKIWIPLSSAKRWNSNPNIGNLSSRYSSTCYEVQNLNRKFCDGDNT